MAGKGGQGEAGAGWLGPVFARLSAKVEEAVAVICDDKIEDADQAEKVARRIAVIARAAKLVDAVRPRVEAESEEDGMGERVYDPEETERLRRELSANCDRIDLILEEKRAEAVERQRSAAGTSNGPGASPSD